MVDMSKCIDRFLEAQKTSYAIAIEEVRNGRKVSHWMWYIFPQLRGLGYSSTAHLYGLNGLDEARRFAADPALGRNLRTITQALLDQPLRNANGIFGSTDAMKLRSCMTLFELADPDCSLYGQVLEEFFGGSRDHKTLTMLRF